MTGQQPARPVRAAKPELQRSVIFTVMVGEERFGLPIDYVRTVFRATHVTPVPLAAKRMIGLINLRGHVVSAICLRACLGLPAGDTDDGLMVALEHRGEGFALAVDNVGDVITVTEEDRVAMPTTIAASRRAITSAVYRVRDVVIPVLDIDAVLGGEQDVAA